MNTSVIDRFISILKQQASQNQNLVETLSELLFLSKESIYKRLQNKVPFTFEEVIKISVRFGISLDEIIYKDEVLNVSQWAILDLDIFYLPENYINQTRNRLLMYMDILRKMKLAKKAEIRCACTILPINFFFPYKKLSFLRYYKWNYLVNGVKPDFLFSKIVYPDDLIEIEKQFVALCREVPRTMIIMDKDIFTYMMNDIRYFIEQQLISQTELLELKSELINLISYIETLAERGTFETGTEINLYLSKINLDTSYYNIECDHETFCMQKSFFIDILEFRNAKFFQKQKDWIELLKRYSYPITQSGEKNRFDFFNRQRKLVEELE